MLLKQWITKGLNMGALVGAEGRVQSFRKEQPDPGSLHVMRPLNSFSLAYWLSEKNFVANRFFSSFPVEKDADSYWVFPRSAFLRPQMKKRAEMAESVGGGWDMQLKQYQLDIYSFHHDISDRRRAKEDSPINSDRMATKFVTWQALLHREQQFANTFLKTGVWSQDWTGNASASNYASHTIKQWDLSGSTPIEDITTIKATQEAKCGNAFPFNKMLVSKNVWDVLRNHSEIVGRIVYGGTNANPAQVTPNAVAQLFGIDELVVMSSMYDASQEGQAENLTPFSSKQFLLVHDPGNAGVETPMAGVTFNWTGYAGMTNGGFRIKKFRMENKAADRIEIEQAYAPYVIGSDLGTFGTTVLS